MSDAPVPTVPDSETQSYRRRYVRIATAFPVSFVLDGETESRSGESGDLGGGGVRLATAEDLPLGASLLLRFRLPAGREVAARGRIVLSFFNAEKQQFNHGVAFTQINPADQEAIVSYVTAEVSRLADAGDTLGSL